MQNEVNDLKITLDEMDRHNPECYEQASLVSVLRLQRRGIDDDKISARLGREIQLEYRMSLSLGDMNTFHIGLRWLSPPEIGVKYSQMALMTITLENEILFTEEVNLIDILKWIKEKQNLFAISHPHIHYFDTYGKQRDVAMTAISHLNDILIARSQYLDRIDCN